MIRGDKMSDNNVKKMVGKVFNDIADAVETGQFGEKIRVGLTAFGSEHGVDKRCRNGSRKG